MPDVAHTPGDTDLAWRASLCGARRSQPSPKTSTAFRRRSAWPEQRDAPSFPGGRVVYHQLGVVDARRTRSRISPSSFDDDLSCPFSRSATLGCTPRAWPEDRNVNLAPLRADSFMEDLRRLDPDAHYGELLTMAGPCSAGQADMLSVHARKSVRQSTH